MSERVVESRPSFLSTLQRSPLWVATAILGFLVLVYVMATALLAWIQQHGAEWVAHNWMFLALLGLISILLMGAKPAWRMYTTLHKHSLDTRAQRAMIEIAEEAKETIRAARERADALDLAFTPQMTLSSLKVAPVAVPSSVRTQVQMEQEEPKQIESRHDINNVSYPSPSDFAQKLESWRPTAQSIYLMETVDGHVTNPLGSLHHIGLAGPTGAGKTNVFRLLLGQTEACADDAEVYLGNPNYAPIKINEKSVEDWRPIAARLSAPPAWRIEDIMEILDSGVAELEDRRQQQQHDPRPRKTIYYAFGEWPAIYSMVLYQYGKKVAEQTVAKMGRLLREARQYNIRVISEFQDALVQTIGGNSGLRENYRTVVYLGGDPVTAKALLDLKPGQMVKEDGLGQLGAAVIRCQTNPLVRGRVPFMSNRALYMLLGEPEMPLPDKVAQLTPQMWDAVARLSPQANTEFYSEPTEKMHFPSREGREGSGKPHIALREQIGSHYWKAPNTPRTTATGQNVNNFRKVVTGELTAPVQPLIKQSEVSASQASEENEDGKFKFTSAEAERVKDLYRAYGSIDKVLKHMERGARWYKDASRILREVGLLKDRKDS